MNLVLLGVPGSGKGTQAELIKEKYRMAHISTGSIFREVLGGSSPLKDRIQGYVSKGLLVPDDIVMQTVEFKIGECSESFLFDGFPRNIAQAKLLDKYLASKSCAIKQAIYLELPFEVSVKRLTARRNCPKCKAGYNLVTMKPEKEGSCDKCGAKLVQREDDREETVEERLKVYERETFPLIEFYERQGKLLRINGDNSVDNIFKDISRKLL